ncbi:hypothetical protein HYU18_04415 [Candidatus Woesearchaeota archaeon]|nr:hypothetical protein [Candidatus Woesearchaeota archaeon]
MPNRSLLTTHRTERRLLRAELNRLVDQINQCHSYMSNNPDSPLQIAHSCIESAEYYALVGSFQSARRNYELSLWLLNSMERTAASERGNGYALTIGQVRELRDFAIRQLKLLEATPNAGPGQLERMVA